MELISDIPDALLCGLLAIVCLSSSRLTTVSSTDLAGAGEVYGRLL